jgi:glucose-6-phosphate 1-epimerase
MNSTTDSLQGHAGWRWSLPQGDSVFVAEQGAQVLSWQAGGRERLYLSPTSACDGTMAIRGGIPVCFPQFNQRGTLPKHAFARSTACRLLA